MTDLLPLFLNLNGRDVLLVGAGPVAAAKLQQLLAAGAQVRIVAPAISGEIQPHPDLTIARRRFAPSDLDGAWLVVAAATPEINRQVADEAEPRRIFVNAVDDPANATAFLSGVVRRDGVTLAISTSGAAPALTALLREGLDALLPRDLASWMWQARAARVAWKRDGVPMDARKPRLLQALNALYRSPEGLRHTASVAPGFISPPVAPGFISPPVAPGFISPPVAPGFISPSVAPGFISPSVAPGFISPSVAPGFISPPVAPGFISPPVAPGFISPPVAPGFISPPVAPGFSSPSVAPGFISPPVAPGFSPAIPWLNAPEDSWL